MYFRAFANSTRSVIAVAVVFLWSESTLSFRSPPARNPGTDIIVPTIIQQIELCISTVTAIVIPCIRLLFGAEHPRTHHSNSGEISKMTDGSFGMVNVRRSFSMRSETRASDAGGANNVGGEWGRIEGIDEVDDPVSCDPSMKSTGSQKAIVNGHVGGANGRP